MPINTHIFRAHTLSKEGRWYAMALEDAYVYGNKITEYSTTKVFKLLNITSLTFHYDFIDRLNILFPGDNYSGFDINKIKCLIPLGLIDLQSQTAAFALFGHKLNQDISRWDTILEITSMNFQNRHRFSEHGLDAHMVSILEKIYGEHFDGYISPIKWPSKIHGHLFPRELCLFKQGNVDEVKEHIREEIQGGAQRIATTIKQKPFDNELAKHRFDALVKKTLAMESFTPLWNPHTEESLPPNRNILTNPKVNTRRKKR